MFQHSIESAKDSKKIKKIFVSSNDGSILSLAKKRLNVNQLIVQIICQKNTPMNIVIKHFIAYLEKKNFS